MTGIHLRRTLPKGFYGRAALIIIVPIVTIQLVVSIMFLQRHFEDVTLQMSRNLTRDVLLVLAQPEVAPNLEISITPQPGPQSDTRVFYDLSGRVVTRHLRETFPQITGVDLASNDKVVTIGMGPDLTLSFARARVSASNPHQLLVLMVVTSVVMTVVAFIFMRNQVRPIKRLAMAAQAFGRGRNVDYRPSGATEIRAAGAAFVDMRNRIERHIDQRTLLLSGVSHDLRTPLTRMRLELSMMEEAEVAGLTRDVDEMAGMIDMFLDFARDGTETEGVVTDLSALLAEVVDGFARTGQTVDFDPGAASVSLSVQPLAVRRAVENLLKNAFRYGQHVALSMTEAQGSVRITVEDDGPGIAPDQRAAATRAFARLDTSRGDSKGSVGLGLAIVTDVARAHGGTLRLEQSATLGGLRAEMVLPK